MFFDFFIRTFKASKLANSTSIHGTSAPTLKNAGVLAYRTAYILDRLWIYAPSFISVNIAWISSQQSTSWIATPWSVRQWYFLPLKRTLLTSVLLETKSIEKTTCLSLKWMEEVISLNTLTVKYLSLSHLSISSRTSPIWPNYSSITKHYFTMLLPSFSMWSVNMIRKGTM